MPSTLNAGHWMGLDSDFQRPRYMEIKAMLAPFVPSGGDIIDVGCGAGVFTQYMPATEVFGIEPNPEAARTAKASGMSVFNGTAEQYLKVGAQQANAIVFNEMLYYSDDPTALLDGFARLLRPNGVILVSIFLKDRRFSARRLLGQIGHPQRPYDNQHCAQKVDVFFREKNWTVLRETKLSVWKLWLARPR